MLAGWLGRNIGFLGNATVVAVLAFAASSALHRKRGRPLHGIVPISFLATFGILAVRNAWGYSIVLTEDERFAGSILLLFSVLLLFGLAVLFLVRSRTRIAAFFCSMAVFFIGFAHPIVEARARSRASSVATSALGQPPMPAEYPRVQIWTNTTDGVAAAFPSPPNRVGATAQSTAAYAYQAAFQFDDGGALASIQISPTEYEFRDAAERAFLSGAHDSFVRTLGAQPSDASTSWDTYGDGRLMLRYAVRFAYEGTPIIGLGFWMLDGRRAIRVSVAYPESLSPANAKVAEHFLYAFLLLSN